MYGLGYLCDAVLLTYRASHAAAVWPVRAWAKGIALAISRAGQHAGRLVTSQKYTPDEPASPSSVVSAPETRKSRHRRRAEAIARVTEAVKVRCRHRILGRPPALIRSPL